MVIHSSPGSHRKKKILLKEETKKTMTPAIFEKKVVIKEPVKVEESTTTSVMDILPTEEFIATSPKKQSRKKVTKTIEE